MTIEEQSILPSKASVDAVEVLIDRFSGNYSQYKKLSYDEANTRTDFIDPFFQHLGWDIANNAGYAEQFREVIREDKVTIDGKVKAPDYSFRQGGRRIFFVEAKKPAVDIKHSIDPAFQVRRYAYTGGLPLSILTDFEELSIYDTRIKPNYKDSASVARTFYTTFDKLLSPYTQGQTHFDYLYSIFSKEAVLKGSFDRYAEESKSKRGTSEFDKDFLKLIEGWRETLAKSLALRNKDLNIHDLNYAIQKIIDRIIFLRIAEDKNSEKYGVLKEAGQTSEIYKALNKIFTKANDKYNSGLFKVDGWLCDLIIDDKVLKQIISELYYPVCPYEFSVLPVETLGSIYEQFIGKTISLTKGHQAKIETKPEVKKAGGVYYTPQYIVSYIVENTLGEKLKGLTPKEIDALRVIDPACGSGSFLVNAYEYLLKHRLEHYLNNTSKAMKEGKLYQVKENDYRLTITEKQSILLNNIYGVDIDSQAVEVAKLSLLLKLMEDENVESEGALFKHSDFKLLPDLSNNIKCGNSLIESDFYNSQNMDLFDTEAIRKINTFDWQVEFKEVFDAGGFDCVIGNPPYGATLTPKERQFLEKRFNVGSTDTAALFLIHSKNISKPKALNGFIIPKSFTYASNWRKTRNALLSDIEIIVDCSKVWKDVKLEMSIYISQKDRPSKSFTSYIRENESIIKVGNIQKAACASFDFIINGISNDELKIGTKIKAAPKNLNDFVSNRRGGMFQKSISDKGDTKAFGGKQINRYSLSNKAKGMVDKKKLKKDEKCFVKTNSILVQNIVAHIMTPRPHIKIISTLANKDDIVILDTINQLSNITDYSSKYILGVLNSSLISWYVYKFVFANAIRTMHFDAGSTAKIPFMEPNKQQHDNIVALVDAMLETQELLIKSKTDHEKKPIEQKARIIDNQINTLVYELYGLSKEEIALIERKGIE